MNRCIALASLLIILAAVVVQHQVKGHGMMQNPPGRSSIWHYYPDQALPNTSENSLNCGGVTVLFFIVTL